jgi:hypothetical protein
MRRETESSSLIRLSNHRLTGKESVSHHAACPLSAFGFQVKGMYHEKVKQLHICGTNLHLENRFQDHTIMFFLQKRRNSHITHKV